MTAIRRVLLLGGSTEAADLARRIVGSSVPIDVTVSFAGRTRERASTPEGITVRVGGFGGITGLKDALHDGGVAAMIDATHPFAARMPFHAAAACRSVGVPLLRVLRPEWAPDLGDRWTRVPSIADAARAVQTSGARRVLLTIGRQDLAPFADCDAELVVRSIDAPDPTVLAGATVLLARAPFTVDGELAVLRSHQIGLIVSKNSGGAATHAKIEAARQLGVPLVMVDRPAAPPVDTVPSVDDAMAWIIERFGASG